MLPLPSVSGDTRLGTGAGNDLITFAGAVTGLNNTYINAGAGNDSVSFTAQVSSASIMGGAGNDSLTFTGVGWTAWDTNKTGIEYYYDSGDGTDTLSFGGTTTGNAQVLGFNVLDSLYDTVTTELVAPLV